MPHQDQDITSSTPKTSRPIIEEMFRPERRTKCVAGIWPAIRKSRSGGSTGKDDETIWSRIPPWPLMLAMSGQEIGFADLIWQAQQRS